jgi:hypothetical protein
LRQLYILLFIRIIGIRNKDKRKEKEKERKTIIRVISLGLIATAIHNYHNILIKDKAAFHYHASVGRII